MNTDFYNSHGFVTVGKFLLGDENPEWHEPSVLVSIVCVTSPVMKLVSHLYLLIGRWSENRSSVLQCLRKTS